MKTCVVVKLEHLLRCMCKMYDKCTLIQMLDLFNCRKSETETLLGFHHALQLFEKKRPTSVARDRVLQLPELKLASAYQGYVACSAGELSQPSLVLRECHVPPNQRSGAPTMPGRVINTSQACLFGYSLLLLFCSMSSIR